VEFLQPFKDVAPFLQHPLVLIGFVVLLFFGVLTALLKTGLLPQLSKKAAAELAKRVINFGFITALLIIALGFWQHARESGTSSSSATNARTDAASNTKREATHAEIVIPPPAKKTFYQITLQIPSDLNDARILVDGKAADIVERKLTSIVLRMEKREKSQEIVLHNDVRSCTTSVMVDGDKILQPCLN
jgi:hypothetical protein